MVGPQRKVAALAGRRIDPPNAESKRFPLDRVDAVRRKLELLLTHEEIKLLVCSAACGADILALEVAQKLEIGCRVILPFDPELFRKTSVIDRPGNWGPRFDAVLAKVKESGGLTVLKQLNAPQHSYRVVTEAIVKKAKFAAMPEKALAILVWEGSRHSDDDATADFEELSVSAGLEISVVLTC